MRLSAYVLLADPAWIETSVASYYHEVDSIVASYDERGLSWTGRPIPVDECIARLAAVDHHNKVRFLPGNHSRADHGPMENETLQRRRALAAAAEHSDWVLQLDTDEVVTDLEALVGCVEEADAAGATGLHYPSRVLRQHVGGDRYLEDCDRLWRVIPSYPGPIAVRGGTHLRMARQCDGALYRVTLGASGRPPPDPGPTTHGAVTLDQAILHLSWVRTDSEMTQKLGNWGHADDADWTPVLRRWRWTARHPYLTVLATPMRRHGLLSRLRITVLRDVDGVSRRHVLLQRP